MPSITFDLETVTPLFLAGADQTTAELRPPAFRGALRYWFRAIASSITTFDRVKKWENKVFGSTDAGGSVIVRVQAEKPTSTKSLERPDSRDTIWTGLSYLLFSVYQSRDKDARGYIPSKRQFKVVLQTRPLVEDGLHCLQLAAGAMWMLVNLGGIGSRSNRGCGNIKINDYEYKDINIPEIDLKSKSTNLSEFELEIQLGIRAIKNLYKSILLATNISLTAPTEFDILHPNTANLYIWQSDNPVINQRWDQLLNAFGSQYKNFRTRYNIPTGDDYPQVKTWISSRGRSRVVTIKRAAFGLPIQFYFTSLPRSNNKASLEADKEIRRSASPFHVKVLSLSKGQFAILIIHFKTQLIPSSCRLVLINKNASTSTKFPSPNQNIIDEFISKLNNISMVTFT